MTGCELHAKMEEAEAEIRDASTEEETPRRLYFLWNDVLGMVRLEGSYRPIEFYVQTVKAGDAK